jgi:hypothetical protein
LTCFISAISSSGDGRPGRRMDLQTGLVCEVSAALT